MINKTNLLITINLVMLGMIALFGVSYSAGWHIADEVLSGNFRGEYNFIGDVKFNNSVTKYLEAKMTVGDTVSDSSSISTEKIIYDTVVKNTFDSAVWNTSTGEFTAPQSGVYQFSVGAWTGNNLYKYYQIWFLVNNIRGRTHNLISADQTGMVVNGIVYLEKDDKLSFHPYTLSSRSLTFNDYLGHTFLVISKLP